MEEPSSKKQICEVDVDDVDQEVENFTQEILKRQKQNLNSRQW